MSNSPITRAARIRTVVLTLLIATAEICSAGGKVAAWGDNDWSQCLIPNGLNTIKAIAGGYYHSVALKADGTVVGWGDNSYGQAKPPPNLNSVVSVAAGDYVSLVLRADGTVAAWGRNLFGQTNVPADLGRVVAIDAGLAHCLALKSDGTVRAWGSQEESTNVPSGLVDVRAVAAGEHHSLALKADGTVVSWGWDTYGETHVPAGLSNVVAIAASYNRSLALKADGTVIVWGYYAHTNVPAGLSDVVAIAAGFYANLALRSDGTLVSWGTAFFQTNMPPGISNVSAIACGEYHNLAIVADGPPEIFSQPADTGIPFQSNVTLSVTVSGFTPLSFRWDYNDGGTVHDSARISGVTTASLIISNAQFSDAGKYSVVVSNAFGSVQSSGATVIVISPPIFTQQPASRAVIAGTNITLTASAIGTPPLTYQWLLNSEAIAGATQSSLNLSNVQSAQAGTYSVIASNNYGVTPGSNAVVEVIATAPYILNQPTNQAVGGGGGATFFVNARGTEPLSYQWRRNGRDLAGATGAILLLTGLRFEDEGYYTVAVSNAVGVTVSAKALLAVSQLAVWGGAPAAVLQFPPGLSNVVAVSAGDSHVVALRADGTVAAWGNQFVRETTPGHYPTNIIYVETNSPATDVPPDLSGVIAVSAGSMHNLALKADGTVVAWGDNASGQTNVPAGLGQVVAIAAGANNSLALRSDGQIVAWGGTSRLIPPTVPLTNVPPGLSNLVGIAAGLGHGMAVKNDGRIVCWGTSTSVPPGVSNVIAVAFGKGNSIARGWPFGAEDDYLALRGDGTVASWSDRYVTLPDGYSLISGLSDVVAIAGGPLSIMALRGNGTVYVSRATNQPPPGVSNVVAIAAGGGNSSSRLTYPPLGASNFYVAIRGNGSPAFTLQPASQSAGRGTPMRLRARAVGLPPLRYQWQLNATNLPGATNADLSIASMRVQDTGDYRLVVTNSLGAATSSVARVSIPFSTNLAVALNTTNLLWTTSPTNALWFAQIRETHDGDVAAQSGLIGHNQQATLQTTLVGPGTLRFWWKVSSEEGYDRLWFNVDVMSSIRAISGENEWQQLTMPIPSGTHVVRWLYSKDATVSAGQDAGWVDEVVFTPAPVITAQPLSQTAWAGSNVTFHAAAHSAGIAFYQWLKNGSNLAGAFGSFLTLTNVSRRDAGEYALQVSNPGGSSTSSNASLVVLVPQRLMAPRRLPDGAFTFSSGEADGHGLLPTDLPSVEILGSTNLQDWIVLTNACTLTNGVLQFRDPDCQLHPSRFYRVVER